MWLAVLMLATMASCSVCPDYDNHHCKCHSPMVECHGHVPPVDRFNGLGNDFVQLIVSDLEDKNELNRLMTNDSSFVVNLETIQVTNVTGLKDAWDLAWYSTTSRNDEVEKERITKYFPNVRVMNFSHNSLEEIPHRYFTVENSSISRLRVLDMRCNELKNIDDTVFSKHCNVVWLCLASNKIQSLQPKVFEKLRYLEYLDLSDNKLKILKTALNPLMSLQRLFLTGNQLERIETIWFKNLSNLIELNLSKNKIIFISSDAFVSLTSLSILNYDDDPKLGKQFLLPLDSRKKQLKINSVPIIDILQTSVTTTKTFSNSSSNRYDCPKFCQCHSPKVKCLGHLPDSTLKLDQLPEEFTELVLQSAELNLELSEMQWNSSSLFINRLQSLKITNFSNLYSFVDIRWWNIKGNYYIPNVKSLNLSYNSFCSVPTTDDHYEFSELNVLDMSNNEIDNLDEAIKFPKLTFLNLSNNKINNIVPTAFVHLKSLEYLNLSCNNLYSLEGVFHQLTSLQRLFLSNNKLEHIGSDWFQNLTKLVELDVSRNKLTFILTDSLQPLISLSVLKLAENPLIKRDLSLLLSIGRRLEIIDASRIGLVRVPAALTHSIRILKLAGNQLTSINSGDLDSYPLLRELNLSENRLISIEEDALGRLENLEELNLSGNILSIIPKSLPNALIKLDLSQNALPSLKISDMQNLNLLRELYVGGNVIKEIEGGFFRQLIALKILDISDNPLIKLTSDTLSGLSNLVVLRMSGLAALKTETNQNQDTAFPFLTPENLVELDLSRSPALTAQLLADNAALSACKRLRELNLAYTSISTLRSDLVYKLPQLQKLNLIGNEWNCSQDQLGLGEWIRQHKSSINYFARCKTPKDYEGKLLSEIYQKPVNVNAIDKPTLTTVLPQKLTTNRITTTQQQPLKNIVQNTKNKTQSLKTIKQEVQNSNTINFKEESSNIFVVVSTTKKMLVTTEIPFLNFTQQTYTTKNNQNKRIDKSEKLTTSFNLNKKVSKNKYIAMQSMQETEITTSTTTTGNGIEKASLTKLKRSSLTPKKDSSSRSSIETKEDKDVFGLSQSKLLLYANEDESFHVNDQPSSNSFAEEPNNSQATESGARVSESMPNGAHPGMLVLLGAAIVAAAALTVVLSRRATVSRRKRPYQRHENIEVHTLTPTMELW